MALDIKKFLKEELNFTDAELTPELVALYTPERVAKIEQGYKRQSDYSRSQDELRTQQTELAAASERLTQEMAEWGTLTAAEKANSLKLQTDLHATQAEVLRLTQSVTSLATAAGRDPKEFLTTTPGAPIVPTTPAVDLSGYVKKEDLANMGGQLNGVAEMALTLPATLAAIAIEHEQLTGQKLDTRTIIAEIRKRAGTRNNQLTLDPESIWMEQHSIADKRTAAATAAHDAEIAAAVDRGRQEARTEALVPGSTSAHAHARIFNRPDGTTRTSVLQRPAPGTIAQGAAAALATGKYRQTNTTPGGNTMPGGR